MKKILATLLLAGALAVTVTPVLAQESTAKSSENGDEKPGLELWKWANFAILAVVLGYLVSKNMGPMLASRSAEIRDGLAAGERAKADADARAAAVKAQLAGLDQAVSQMKAEAREELNRETARLQCDAAGELERIQQQSVLEIESAGKLARLEVQRYAAKLAIDLAEQKVRARMSPDVQAGLLQNFLAGMPGEN